MTENSQRESVLGSFFYKAAESFGNQGIAFVVNIILARLIDPSDYGILTLLAIFIAIARVLMQSGLSTALVQKPDVQDIDYSGSFWFSFALSGMLYLLLFIFAPSIAKFYNQPNITSVMRVLALMLFPGALSVVQNAIVARERKFSQLMRSSLLATLISGIIGIAMAYAGQKYWALVAQQLSMQFLLVFFLWRKLDWLPKFEIDFKRLGALLGFGWKLLVSGLFDVIYENLRGLIIGKKFNESNLGFYNRGRQFPELIVSSINNTIQSVLLPLLSEYQSKAEEFRAYMKKSLQLSTYVVFPMMMGLAVLAEPIVRVLLTDKWLACVPYLQLACIDFALFPIHTANLQAINAIGRSDVFLKLEIIKKTYGILILVASVIFFDSVLAIVAGATISSIISAFVNAFPAGKLFSYPIKNQCKDMMSNILASLFMGVILYFSNFISLPIFPKLILQIIIGMLVYFAYSAIFKLESFSTVKMIIQRIRKRKNNENATI